MTVFNDGVGNYYLGDCKFATHRIDYPTIRTLRAHPVSTFVSGITQLASNSGLLLGSVTAQSSWQTPNTQGLSINFSPIGDSTSTRYRFNTHYYSLLGTQYIYPSPFVTINNSSGTSIASTGQQPGDQIWNSFPFALPVDIDSTFDDMAFVAVSDGKSLGLVICQKNFSGRNYLNRFDFYYAGELEQVNLGFNRYTTDVISKSVAFCTRFSVSNGNTFASNTIFGVHYISNASKSVLSTGDAQYPIVCSDEQLPTTQWATDFLVFEDNSVLGNPCMGKVRNLLLSTATGLTIGKPVYIRGTTVPDGGSRWYLPVGTFAGRTLLMRCYSSVEV